MAWLIRLVFACCFAALVPAGCAAEAELILHNGKVVTADDKFSIHEAIAVRDGRIVEAGLSSDALKSRGTRLWKSWICAGGKLVHSRKR